MSEARELFERAAKDIYQRAARVEDDPSRMTMADRLIASIEARVMRNFSGALATALATQPEPGAVPELPEWVEETVSGHWHIYLSDRSYQWLPGGILPDDLERIAEACTKLAARERARRAGS